MPRDVAHLAQRLKFLGAFLTKRDVPFHFMAGLGRQVAVEVLGE
jgi:hypothetical protein